MSLDKQLEEILKDRIKFVGEGEHTYLGTPDEMIKALTHLIHQREREARLDELELLEKADITASHLIQRLAILKQEEEK